MSVCLTYEDKEVDIIMATPFFSPIRFHEYFRDDHSQTASDCRMNFWIAHIKFNFFKISSPEHIFIIMYLSSTWYSCQLRVIIIIRVFLACS